MSGFKQGGLKLYTYLFCFWWLPWGSLSIGYTSSIKNGIFSLAIDGLLKTLDWSNEPQVAPSLFATFELVFSAPNSLFLTSIDVKFGFGHDIDAKHQSYASPHVPKVETNVDKDEIWNDHWHMALKLHSLHCVGCHFQLHSLFHLVGFLYNDIVGFDVLV